MAKKKEPAVFTEPDAANNPHLKKLTDNLVAGFKTNRMSKSNRNLRLNNTALIPNEKPIFAWKKDANGTKVEPRLVFRAGWYVSVAENAVIEEILNDPDNKALNEHAWAQMEKAGKQVSKPAASQSDVKVISGSDA